MKVSFWLSYALLLVFCLAYLIVGQITCRPGYVYNSQQQCVPYYACAAYQPCKNGGFCEDQSSVDNDSPTTLPYRCFCTGNTTGQHCEILLKCSTTSCPTNSDCFVANNQINCICKDGYCLDGNGQCSVRKTQQACLWGDPHYSTFDGLTFDYQGTCPYIVTQPCNQNDISPYFSIRAQNMEWESKRMSLVSSVQLSIFGHVFAGDSHLAFTVDGVRMEVPYSYQHPNQTSWSLAAYIASGQMFIATSNYLQIIFNPLLPIGLCVTVPEEMFGTGRLCGLFGDVDDNCHNDLRGVNKSVIGLPPNNCSMYYPADQSNGQMGEQFGDNWIYDLQNGACIPGTKMTNASLPCSLSDYVKAENACQAIIQAKNGVGVFAKCAGLGAAFDALFFGCVYDTCADNRLLCNALTQLVHSCQQAFPGTTIIGWRNNVCCPLTCPTNQYYGECVSGCQPSCANTTTSLVCNKPCLDGCTCVDGTVLDGTGLNCIPQDNCHHTNINGTCNLCTILQPCGNGGNCAAASGNCANNTYRLTKLPDDNGEKEVLAALLDCSQESVNDACRRIVKANSSIPIPIWALILIGILIVVVAVVSFIIGYCCHSCMAHK